MLVAATLNGFGSAIMWVGQGQFVSMCANESNKGQYNSIFWAILKMSSIIGNLMSAFVIASVNQSTFYLVMTAICAISSIFLLLI